MKAVINEYGYLIATAIVATLFAVFILSSDSSGMLQKYSSAKPKSEFNTKDSSDKLLKEDLRLDINATKLRSGDRYSWLDFVTTATGRNGSALTVEVTKVAYPDGSIIDRYPSQVIRIETLGKYIVTYKGTSLENHTIEKEVVFLADR